MRGKIAKLLGRTADVRERTGIATHPTMKELHRGWSKLTPKQRRKWRHRMLVKDSNQRQLEQIKRAARILDAERIRAIRQLRREQGAPEESLLDVLRNTQGDDA